MRRTTRLRRISWILFAFPALLSAQERLLTVERFDAAIRVDRDGTIHVTESITARFTGSWNGIYRTIPVEYRTPQGFNWTLGLDLQGVTDQNNQPLRTESSREGHYIKYKIWVPGAENATRVVVLRYRARNGLRFFEDHDELYWNVTGDEWDVPIEAASAVIELPAQAQGVRAISFNGVYGSTAQEAQVETSGTSVRITMPHRLEFQEGLTAVVGWNKGVVAEPTASDRAVGFLRSNWPLAIPIPVFLLVFSIWRKRGRDPRKRPISVRYEPPDGITPAEAGTLLDNSADMRDITATMVDLAVRGYLKFEERDEPKLFGLLSDKEYYLHRLKLEPEWNTLAPHETKVLRGLFDGRGAVVALSDLEDEFYSELPGIKKQIFERLLGHGFYRARPDNVRSAWVIGGIVLGALLIAGGGSIAGRFSLTPVPFVVAGVLSGLIVLGFGLVMPARTEGGTRALEKVLGFEEFLRRVEAEHMEHVMKSPELFDRYLPFAMAFGVEKKWAKAFEDIYTQPPTWYVGPSVTHFNVGRFSSSLSGMTSKVSSTMSSSPRSSGGSGFGGGGSSGGGGGGGGGGGF
ncbi:MAG TPA: DUF2207 domain-containing protein [Gemmatimonadales bacterium]